MKNAWLIAVAAAVVPASAQFPAVVTPSRLIKPKPVVKPEPARRVSADPLRICQLLLSTSPADRLRGHGLLGMQLDRDMGSPEVLYRSVNLDADDEPESILVISDGRTSAAYVFDRQSGAWWIVGEFGYWWHWHAEQAERFITLKPLVSDGMDILVRVQEGGTNVQTTDLSIYRLLNGRLYCTFQTAEAHSYDTFDTKVHVDERAEIEVESQSDAGTFLIVRRRTDTTPKEPPDAKATAKRSCAARRWNAAQFRFVTEPTANARTLCASQSLTRSRLH